MALASLSCGTDLNIKNIRIYGDAGSGGASYIDTLDNTPLTHVLKPDWDVLRVGMICTASFDVIKDELEKACAIARCDYDQTLALETAIKKIQSTQPTKP